jgi:nucleoid-associated protein YgaU
MRFITLDLSAAKEAEVLARHRASRQAMHRPENDGAPRRPAAAPREASAQGDHVGQPMPRGSRLPPQKSAGAEPAWITYTVQRGDTLRGIAEWFYGDRDRWGLIYAANRAVVPQPERLDAGVVLMIPRPRPRQSAPLA